MKQIALIGLVSAVFAVLSWRGLEKNRNNNKWYYFFLILFGIFMSIVVSCAIIVGGEY